MPNTFRIMKFTLYFLALSLVMAIVSCGPSDEDKARVRVNYARLLLERQDTLQALLQLDSVAILHPKSTYSANAAKNLKLEINSVLVQRKGTELDSVNARIVKLEGSFVKEKTEFDRYTRIIHKKQTLQQSLNRSFIEVHLDERGELFISSNYCGKTPVNHVGIRVYDNEISAKTDTIPLGDVNNHKSDFMEYKWEKVSYRNGRDNGVIQFIADNAERKLKAVFLGKGQYYIILEDSDKKAVQDALALSEAIKQKVALEQKIKTLQEKLRIR